MKKYYEDFLAYFSIFGLYFRYLWYLRRRLLTAAALTKFSKRRLRSPVMATWSKRSLEREREDRSTRVSTCPCRHFWLHRRPPFQRNLRHLDSHRVEWTWIEEVLASLQSLAEIFSKCGTRNLCGTQNLCGTRNKLVFVFGNANIVKIQAAEVLMTCGNCGIITGCGTRNEQKFECTLRS